MDELELRLRNKMRDAIRVCQSELGWNPTTAIQMMNEHGAVGAATTMVLTPGGTTGFTRCWEEDRLDVSIEHLIIDPDFEELFQPEVLAAARERLDQARKNPPRKH